MSRIFSPTTYSFAVAFGPPFHPPQMQLVASYLREKEVHTALAAEDFNSIQPFGRTLHINNNLNDACLKLGGKEVAEEGFTLYLGSVSGGNEREQFGCSRMDR
ncbi:hypothetical protein F5B19DRAFT_460916 [Rostrohypoxylon terebratum]|nr:hypothetical protein F5B19DRAFT_460916 [Rostrohypoxylon terebratum]